MAAFGFTTSTNHCIISTRDTAASRIPIEIWEYILDVLKDDPHALLACELVCRGWRTRSRYLLDQVDYEPTFCERESVVRWARFMQVIKKHRARVTRVDLAGEHSQEGQPGSLAHLGTFVAMLAGRLPHLRHLYIRDGAWPRGTIHASTVFFHLSTFPSVSKLWLNNITFPSVTIFGRLICSFKRLSELRAHNISFVDTQLPPRGRPWLAPTKLTHIYMDRASSDMLRALTATTVAQKCHELDVSASGEAIRSSALQELLWAARESLHTLSLDLFTSLETSDMRDLVGR
ncbi:hypothetical protein WOLCODRAFT_70075 [Wolfiporia cocos MD-104 SS10]|uniref:F-box domain-containing protein n=1 Tax=Wolfiporia cocos (strain MD-104) TaxID=742152 RepID=A0A2H3JUZ2_WOLCO|nr:hypothetical protein WOLCODRAFT_70075 [Wolfiporia cocos MD-104 SS10]